MPRHEKVVYLTFDDGPIPDVTDFVLKTLKTFGAKATFFCIGDNIVNHPIVFESIIKDGHHIGNHTFNHLKGWDTKNEAYLENMQKCQALTNTDLFRPPYGRIKSTQIKLLKEKFSVGSFKSEVSNAQFSIDNRQTEILSLQIVMWDVLSGDFDTSINGEKCYQNVIKNAENGSIIVFHDSLKALDRLEYALPKVLKYFKENGYQFGVL